MTRRREERQQERKTGKHKSLRNHKGNALRLESCALKKGLLQAFLLWWQIPDTFHNSVYSQIVTGMCFRNFEPLQVSTEFQSV